jgi:hypothetical protein
MVISVEMKEWTKEEVFEWLKTVCNLPEEQAQKFFTADINGEALLCLDKQDLMDAPLQLTLGAAKRLLRHVHNASGQFLFLSAFHGAHGKTMLARACCL